MEVGVLLRKAVAAFSVVLLEGLDLEAHLFGNRAADEAADAVSLMPMSA